MRKSFIAYCLFLTLLSSCSFVETLDNNELKTRKFYDCLIKSKPENIAAINQFFTAMPKGGDIHHHYSGSVYAETYLDWVKEKNYFINCKTLKVDKTQKQNSITVDSLRDNSKLYDDLIELWSDRNYGNHYHNQESPDQQFFNTFSYFGSISKNNILKGLKLLKDRAINENISYIETMLSKVGIKADTSYFNKKAIDTYNNNLRNAGTQLSVDAILSEIDVLYLSSDKFMQDIKDYTSKLEEYSSVIDTIDFKMRFQAYASRTSSPLQVYTDLLSAYIAANNSEYVVGVNIVAAENSSTAIQDYTLHMRFFNHLNKKFPNVKKSLHAGELTLGMVRPKNLLFHINEAVEIAKAQRIGHGVDIPYEKNSYEILNTLKNDSIAIEINLTSNEFILGVKDNSHPYLIYAKSDVPMVISTDDSGVSRNNLSNEFVKLATRYKPSYKQLKEYIYNSIKYSFLSENEKKQSIATLDKKFDIFEETISKHSSI